MKPCPLHPDETEPCRPEWCGVARVRSAMQSAPRKQSRVVDKPDPIRDLAKARARIDRANAKEQP